jgi:uncharacterized membrane-anchored protein
MSLLIRRAIMLVGLAIVLVAINTTIRARERLLTEGEKVYLELAPIDPRSLMQGDYMALRFALGREIDKALASARVDGLAVIRLDNKNRATFVRIDQGQPLAAGERRIAFKTRDREVRIVTNAYFFQEGTGRAFEGARFGEFRLSPDGRALMTHLTDAQLKVLKTGVE